MFVLQLLLAIKQAAGANSVLSMSVIFHCGGYCRVIVFMDFAFVIQARIPRVEEDPSWYFELLSPLVKHLDMWSSEYCQQLRSAPPSYSDSHDVDSLVRHPVLDYTRATGLLPILEALGGEGTRDCELYLEKYEELITEAYPLRVVKNPHFSAGKYVTLMPFKRFFFVCKV